MADIVIAGGARTPVGSFNGSLSSVSASYLGEVAIREAMARAKVAPEDVDEVVLQSSVADMLMSRSSPRLPSRHLLPAGWS